MALISAGSKSASVKFDRIGDGVTGALINVTQLDVRDFNTGAPELYTRGSKTGQVKQQERIELIALEGHGSATAGKDRESITEGSFVTVWSSGYKRKAFFDALKEHAGDLDEGDIYTIVHTEEEQGASKFAAKLYEVTFRKPETDAEKTVSALAISEHAASQYDNAGTGAPPDLQEEPF